MVDGRWLTSDAAAPVREALLQTSVEEDEAMLGDESLSVAARAAIGFRAHMKRALVAGQEAKKMMEKSGDEALFGVKEPKPHILPDDVKAQLARAGVAFAGEIGDEGDDADQREALLQTSVEEDEAMLGDVAYIASSLRLQCARARVAW